MSHAEAIILGLIEGLTEFLPVSSTGHLILAETLMQNYGQPFVQMFTVVIQSGAIAAVGLIYIRRFLSEPRLYATLALAFAPTAVIGLLFAKKIKLFLFNPIAVSIALIVGGIALLFFDRLEKKPGTPEVTGRRAFAIGLFQCLALVPGISRAAATMGGGLFMGLTRAQAVEFSFLLAVPTLVAATGYDLFKERELLTSANLTPLLIGTAVAFVSALAAVRFFVAFISKRGFAFFGVYRIIVGAIFLVLLWGRSL